MAIRFGSRVLKRAEGRFAGLRAWERLFAQQGIAEANTDQQVQGLLSRRLLSTQNLPLTLCTISTAGLGVFNHGGPAADCRWHSQAGHVSLHQRSSSTVAVRSGLEGGDDADASGQLGILRSEEVLVGAWKVELETGKLARLADGSCMGRMGDTCVLSTVVCERSPQQAPSDMVPLQVHYREKLSAVGEIPRNFTRREGNPKDREVLCMRLLDRAIRPLFPPGFCHEIQVTTLALSIDGENDTDMLSINTASAALTCSSIPWNGPVGAVRIAYTGGQPVVNPTASELKEAQMELVYAGTQDRTVMMECDASEVPEDVLADMLRLAHQEVQKLLELQSRLVSPNAETKRKIFLTAADAEAAERVASLAAPLIEDMFRRPGMRKAERSSARREAKRAVLQQLQEQGAMRRDNDRVPGSGCVSQADLDIAFAAAEARALRGMALAEGLRIDGRGIHDIRPLETEVDLLPVVHGSALFGRGETQSLCTATVGGEGDTQVEDDVMGMATRSLFVHYTFPSFAVNETRKAGGLSRRELGHGRLAERALRPVMPDIDQFPFPVRLTAETLSSNGSSSMAAVCAGSLALKNAGVPIKSLVAGVSIGLITDAQIDYAQQEYGGAFHSESRESPGRVGRHVLLTDIQGLEDHLGCMDFKIAGTAAGITATQLDTKFPGVPVGIVTEALQPSLKARRQILEAMGGCLQRGRRQRKPKFGTVEVDKDLAGILIGPRGRTIQGMQAATGARLILRSEAKEMAIYAPTEQQYDRAETAILDVQGANIREGDVYDVKVVTLTDFGAFVELPNGFQALLHISELSHSRIRAVEDVVHEGQEFKVQCLGRDHKGNVKLSRKALLPKPQGWS